MLWLNPSQSSLYDHLSLMTCNNFYVLVNNASSLCLIMSIIALLVGRYQSFANLHLYWVWVLLVHPTPKNQSFAKSVHYIYLIACFYSKARFLLYTLSNQECFMWKIVSKALTNLMVHFIFLLIRSLNHCDYLMMYMPANYELKVSRIMCHGERFQHRFVSHFKLISCFFCFWMPFGVK